MIKQFDPETKEAAIIEEGFGGEVFKTFEETADRRWRFDIRRRIDCIHRALVAHGIEVKDICE